MTHPPPPSPRRTALGLALVVVVATLIGATVTGLSRLLPESSLQAPLDRLIPLAVAAACTVLFVVPTVWAVRRFVDRAPLRDLGFGSLRHTWAPTLTVTGVLAITAVAQFTVALTVGGSTITPGSTGTALLAVVTVLPLLLLAQAVPEELVFRGYVQNALGRTVAPLSVLLLQSALFAGSVSLVTGSFDNAVNLFLLGVFLGVLRQAGGDLWTVLGARLTLAVPAVLVPALRMGEAGPAADPWPVAVDIAGCVSAYVALRVVQAHRSDVTAVGGPEPLPRRELPIKGILYDVGSSYMPGQNSRARWVPETVREELRVIDEELHCTTVTLFGRDLDRMEEAARIALDRGLEVWLQPRSMDAGHEEVIAHVERAADLAERLRLEHPDRVVLSVGCELTILNRGIVPGPNMDVRVWMLNIYALVMPYVNGKLNRLLRRVAATARARFQGPLTYASGTWESVDWAPFDIIGVDYYLDVLTRGTYRQGLRALRRFGKPVVVTEFGCCSYQGARAKGGSGGDIMLWHDLNDRRIRRGHVRDENVQAEMIDELLDVYETEDVHGAFLCMFIEGDCHYSPDPDRDQDMASFGIVRPPSVESGLSADDGHWEPKLGFHTLARRYAARIPTG